MKNSVLALLILALVGCKGGDLSPVRETPAPPTAHSPQVAPRTADSAEAEEMPPPFSALEVCKGGIAVTMGRDPKTMKVLQHAGVVEVSYTRDDGTKWSYRCRLEGERIVWASDTGRWRTGPDDGVLTYSVTSDGQLQVVERFSDGSSTRQQFSQSELRP